MKRVLPSALFAFALAFPAAVGAAPDAPAPSPAAVAFDKLKSLVGTWETDMDGDGKADATVVYRTTAGGSALEETLFAGTPKEMVTMYTVDGSDLVLTHYCHLGNQPRMKAVLPATDKIAFEFAGGGNLPSRDAIHMDSLTVTWKDAKSFHQDWTLWKDGKVMKTVSFDWTKKA